jgi:light-regulated signal transduction histidine kinase (bacteriophytochrome)
LNWITPFTESFTGAETIYFVKDNGIGFDQEYADRLFGAFNRLGDASAAEGVGLGLTIAARVVERHGGGIWAKGKKNFGATFYFTLGDAV